MLQIQFDFQCLLLVVASGMINSLKAQPIYNSKLSSRELDVLSYLSRGKTAKEIGMQLAISRRTVEHHIENIIYLENHVSIINFKIPESWVGKNLAELSIRQKYELNIIGTRLHKGGHLKLNVDPNTPLPPNIILVVIANDHTFEKFDYLGYLK